MHRGFWNSPEWGDAFGHGRHGHGRGRKLKRGILKFVLLKLLADEARHGYELIRLFRRKGWAGGPGSIYPLLAALEEEGFISGRDDGERRVYEATEAGKRHVREHAADLHDFFAQAPDESEPGPREPRSELSESAGRLMQAVSQLGSSSKPETIARVRDVLDNARKEIYTLLARE